MSAPVAKPVPQCQCPRSVLRAPKMFDALMADYSEELSLLRTHYGSVNRAVLLGIGTKERVRHPYVCISPVSIGSNMSHSNVILRGTSDYQCITSTRRTHQSTSNRPVRAVHTTDTRCAQPCSSFTGINTETVY